MDGGHQIDGCAALLRSSLHGLWPFDVSAFQRVEPRGGHQFPRRLEFGFSPCSLDATLGLVGDWMTRVDTLCMREIGMRDRSALFFVSLERLWYYWLFVLSMILCMTALGLPRRSYAISVSVNWG